MDEASRFILYSHSWSAWLLAGLCGVVVILGAGVIPASIVFRRIRRIRFATSANHLNENTKSAVSRSGRDQPIRRGDLLWIGPLLAACLGYVLLREGPMSLRVATSRVELEYRLPWRNRSIEYADIQEVRLIERSRSRRGIGSTWPVLLIDVAGGAVEIMAESASYHANVRAAYQEIEGKTGASRGRVSNK